jgi:predicted RND superfamily exporter protein
MFSRIFENVIVTLARSYAFALMIITPLTILLIGGVVIGLAVDDTIHFMYKFNRYFEESGDARWAVHETLVTTGSALLFTSLVLGGTRLSLGLAPALAGPCLAQGMCVGAADLRHLRNDPHQSSV